MWYQHLSQYRFSHGFKDDDMFPWIIIKHHRIEFFIIPIYVYLCWWSQYHWNMSNAIEDVVMLSRQFEMKDLSLTTVCLGLQIEHLSNGILLHRRFYIHTILKWFSTNQAHSIRTPMVVRFVDLLVTHFGQDLLTSQHWDTISLHGCCWCTYVLG